VIRTRLKPDNFVISTGGSAIAIAEQIPNKQIISERMGYTPLRVVGSGYLTALRDRPILESLGELRWRDFSGRTPLPLGVPAARRPGGGAAKKGAQRGSPGQGASGEGAPESGIRGAVPS
jgi:hypothetical protein